MNNIIMDGGRTEITSAAGRPTRARRRSSVRSVERLSSARGSVDGRVSSQKENLRSRRSSTRSTEGPRAAKENVDAGMHSSRKSQEERQMRRSSSRAGGSAQDKHRGNIVLSSRRNEEERKLRRSSSRAAWDAAEGNSGGGRRVLSSRRSQEEREQEGRAQELDWAVWMVAEVTGCSAVRSLGSRPSQDSMDASRDKQVLSSRRTPRMTRSQTADDQLEQTSHSRGPRPVLTKRRSLTESAKLLDEIKGSQIVEFQQQKYRPDLSLSRSSITSSVNDPGDLFSPVPENAAKLSFTKNTPSFLDDNEELIEKDEKEDVIGINKLEKALLFWLVGIKKMVVKAAFFVIFITSKNKTSSFRRTTTNAPNSLEDK
eukprot:CAMPEP_0194570492 /NCGR_PEP_ID=MMETSP0292-20121207/7778_1 /TAXON_ID=39354 /ORGANISM="Heterosigma akashiwo, Strain CCMP2393" /LENGTH=370 /DNA_ID=CAMNT_0039420937 /DNA_START=84 /DNA_END=1198 /DNA_ORIENTATION=+